MNDRMEMVAGVDQDRHHVTLEMRQNGKPLGHVFLDSSTAETLIHNLAGCRSQLTEQVVDNLDIGSRLDAIIDPVWKTQPNRYPEGRLLALRHPGFGWLSFLFPDKEAVSVNNHNAYALYPTIASFKERDLLGKPTYCMTSKEIEFYFSKIVRLQNLSHILSDKVTYIQRPPFPRRRVRQHLM
jgi:hypothetical protein